MQKVNSGDLVGGIASLDSLVEAHPDFAQSWAGVGRAYCLAKNYEKSLAAYQRSVEMSPEAPNLIFNLGLAHAFLNHRDDPFEWLKKAKAANEVNMALVDGNAVA